MVYRLRRILQYLLGRPIAYGTKTTAGNGPKTSRVLIVGRVVQKGSSPFNPANAHHFPAVK